MKKTVIAEPTPACWDPEALYMKAQRCVQHMSELESDNWEYALWAGFSLEFLARAALANVSPTLLAETDKNWNNLYHALGFPPKEEKFVPKSITVSEVFKRLTSILPGFNKENENFCIYHTTLRNTELHTGQPGFDGIKGSAWQPGFYQTCNILLTSLGFSLSDFVGRDEARVAKQLIAAAADDRAKAVKGDVDAHSKVWLAKSEKERLTLRKQAEIRATRQAGHRVNCPACDSVALVVGEAVSPPLQKLNNDQITETQEHLPNQFECVACGLKISGLSRLAAVGLSDRYKKTSIYDAAEYYAPEDAQSGYGEDNNEP